MCVSIIRNMKKAYFVIRGVLSSTTTMVGCIALMIVVAAEGTRMGIGGGLLANAVGHDVLAARSHDVVEIEIQ